MFALVSCSSMKEAGQVLRNEKVKTNDEFLVKKKQPLILPPNYEKIPEPERKRFLATYPTWKKDVFADETNARLAAYAKAFIKKVPKDERAKFYKSLGKTLKEDFLKDYPDWKHDI